MREVSGRRYVLSAKPAILPTAPLSGGPVKHYRVNKLDKHGGEIVKRKDVLANNDTQALIDAAAHEDCPVCEVWHAGEKVGSID